MTGIAPHHHEHAQRAESADHAGGAGREIRDGVGYHVCVSVQEIPMPVVISYYSRNIMSNDQKKEWFLRLNPNGRIPVLVDNTQSPPFAVMETSAELLYLLKFADKDDVFGFKDEYERSQALQWLFFWHGSGAPYQGQMNHFNKFAKDKIPCMFIEHRLCGPS